MGNEVVNRGNRKNIGLSRPARGREPDWIQDCLIWGSWILGGFIVVYAIGSGMDILEMTLLVALYALCVVPFVNWYLEGMKWIPLGEAFTLLHLPYYVLPAALGEWNWVGFSESERLRTLAAIILFLLVFLAIYRVLLHRGWKSLEQLPLIHREMRVTAMWVIFGLWVLGSILDAVHLVPNWAGFRNVFETFLTAVGALGIAYIFYQMGRGRISLYPRACALTGFAIGMVASFSNGLLQGNAQTLGVALLSYTLGSKKVPVRSIVISMFILMIMQLGKIEFRAMSWNQVTVADGTSGGFVEEYQTWLNAGWSNLTAKEGESTGVWSILERISLIHILGLAMAETPVTQPFLNGQTYLMLPELLMPRYFWPDKPRGTLPSETIGIYYGVQNEKNANFTGVSVGPLAEAWANFGWCGLIGAASFFAGLYGASARVSRMLVPNHVGWLLAAVVLTYSVKMELCIAEIICSLLQTLLVAAIILYVLSTPPSSARPHPPAKAQRPAPLRPSIR